MYKRDVPGGVMLPIGIHYIDVLEYLMGPSGLSNASYASAYSDLHDGLRFLERGAQGSRPVACPADAPSRARGSGVRRTQC